MKTFYVHKNEKILCEITAPDEDIQEIQDLFFEKEYRGYIVSEAYDEGE